MNTFFPSTITEGNKLDLSIHNSTSLNISKDTLLQFGKSFENSAYTCHNSIGVKYLTWLRLGFSHLHYHRFKHGFLDAIDPLCTCSTAIENTAHYFVHCPTYQMRKISFSMKLLLLTNQLLTKMKSKLFYSNVFYGNPTYSVNDNI